MVLLPFGSVLVDFGRIDLAWSGVAGADCLRRELRSEFADRAGER